MINKKHKDRLFQKLFGDEKYKDNLLSLYNALNGTDYHNIEDLTITTIEDVIYMGMKNDVSCIIDDYLSLHEHQSTYNPNMPLRGMMYFGKLYDKYVKENDLDIYSDRLLKLPTPKYFVLYNGTDEKEDKILLKLSDAFIHPVDAGEFEWTATMLNINYGHNETIMNACQTLREYSIFVSKIQILRKKGNDVEKAVNKAVEDCIQEGILAEYLKAHKAEVIDVCITEYNEADALFVSRKEERLHTIFELVQDGDLEPEKAARKLGLTVDELEKRMADNGYTIPCYA